MGKKRKNGTETIRAVRMLDGTEHSVVREDGKYYHCADRSIRKLNPKIQSVVYAEKSDYEYEHKTENLEGWDE